MGEIRYDIKARSGEQRMKRLAFFSLSLPRWRIAGLDEERRKKEGEKAS